MIQDFYGNRRFYGIYRGVVIDDNDPLGQRRLKLKIPQVLHDNVSEWAWEKESSGIKRYVPEINQAVWAMFEGGDPSYPVWIGLFGKGNSNGNYIDGGSA